MDIQAELIRPAIERLDGRICVSEACIGSLTPYFPYAYDVIPNGIDADHFSPDAEPVPSWPATTARSSSSAASTRATAWTR